MRTEQTTAEAEDEVRYLKNRVKPASKFILLVVPRRYMYFCGGSYCFMSWYLKILCCWRLMYAIIFLVKFGWLSGCTLIKNV